MQRGQDFRAVLCLVIVSLGISLGVPVAIASDGIALATCAPDDSPIPGGVEATGPPLLAGLCWSGLARQPGPFLRSEPAADVPCDDAGAPCAPPRYSGTGFARGRSQRRGGATSRVLPSLINPPLRC
jgi:hypothetical protein